MLEACKGKISKFDEQLETLNKCEDVIKVVIYKYLQKGKSELFQHQID